jgi:hypothetical protein
MPLKLNALYNNTDEGRKHRSEKVHTKHFKTIISTKNNYIKDYHYHTGTVGMMYKTTIRPLNPMQYDLNNGDAPAVVSCSCPDFKFRWEYANTQSQNAEIKYSNGQPAIVTNPSNRKQLCKHLYAITSDVLTKNKKNVEDMKTSEYIRQKNKEMSSPLQDIAKQFDNKMRG